MSLAEDILGFCSRCFRVRWLARIEGERSGMPHGICRSCAREEADTETADTETA